MKRIGILLIGIGMWCSVQAQNITAIEYFFDADPGYGSGTSVTITPATTINNLTFNASVTAISDGFHTITVRAKDANNRWSHAFTRPFYKLSASAVTSAPNITKLEYFFDNDPGYGAGINVPITTGTSINSLDVTASLSSVADGFHIISFRAQDANGNWSHAFNRPFYKLPASTGAAATNITKLEYFVDNDPGYGASTNVTITPGTSIVDLNVNAALTSVADGFHIITFRAQNASGNWSHAFNRPFYKLPASTGAAATNITKLEYFVDNDPGYGAGTNVTITPGTSIVDLNVNAALTAVSDGFHIITFRAQNASGNWSHAFNRPFYKLPASTGAAAPNITKLEYFFDNDPGYGAGTNVTITPGTSIVDLNVNAALTSVTDGFHTITFRTQNASGNWSHAFTRPFYKLPASAVAAAPNITKLEYFIDNDPGYGAGTNVTITPGTSIVSLPVDVGVSSVTTGSHLVTLRAQDANGRWSIVHISNFLKLVDAPAAQPTNLSFTNVLTTSMTVSWTAATGTPAGYLVLRKAASSPTEIPVDGTNYTAGNTIGTSTVVYVGNAVTFNETGLTAATAYHYDIFSYSGTTGAFNYLTTNPLEGSRSTLANQPSSQPSAINFTNVTDVSMTVAFTAASGTPSGYIGLIKSGSSSTDVPVDGTTYTTGNTIGTSTVAFVGSSTSYSVTGLSASTQYFYDIFAYNGTTGSYNYITTSPLEGSQTTLAAQPASQPTAINFTNITDVGMTVSFTAATGAPSGYIALRKTGSSPTDLPLDGTTYSAGNTIGTSTVAYVGSSTTFNVTGLTSGLSYCYDIFSYNGTTGTYNYLGTSPLEGCQTTLITQPSAQPTSISFSNVNDVSMSVSFTAATGAPAGYLVIIKSGSSPTESPVDGTNYAVGDNIGTSKVAYVGSANNFTVSALSPSTVYFFDIFSFNGSTGTYNYLTTAPLEGSRTTLAAEPLSQPTGLSFPGITVNSLTVSFTAAVSNPGGYIVIRKAGSAPTAAPQDGTAYVANADLGDSKVAYVGSNVSFEDTNLTASTTYYYKVFAFNGNGADNNYLITTPLENNATTKKPALIITQQPLSGTHPIGSTLSANITVNDATGVSSAVIKYKGISESADAWKTAPVTNTGNKYEKIFSTSELGDPIGLKYYFEVTDIDQNKIPSNTGKSYLNYPSSSSEQKIPGLTFGSEQKNYQIISIPLTLTNNSVTNVFAALGSYDNTKWRLFDYVPGERRNREFAEFNTVVPGKGYWLIARNSATIVPGAGTTVNVDEDTPFEITLTPGWNLIGNPYNFKISWAEVLTASGNPANISTSISTFINGKLDASTTLDRYQGGFINNTGQSNVTVKVPVLRNTTLGGGRNSEIIDLKNNIWTLPLAISNGELSNLRGGIGMHPKASINFVDAFDAEQVPLLSGLTMPEIYFATAAKTVLSKQVVPTQENFTWQFTVDQFSETGASLTWPTIERTDKKLMLLDLATMRTVDMTQQPEVTLGKDSKTLKIFYGTSQYVNSALEKELPALGVPYPNPAREEVKIPFFITESANTANVKIEVYNNMGMKVNTLVDNTFAAGSHELLWKPEVPKGLYFISMMVGNNEKRVKVVIQ